MTEPEKKLHINWRKDFIFIALAVLMVEAILVKRCTHGLPPVLNKLKNSWSVYLVSAKTDRVDVLKLKNNELPDSINYEAIGEIFNTREECFEEGKKQLENYNSKLDLKEGSRYDIIFCAYGCELNEYAKKRAEETGLGHDNTYSLAELNCTQVVHQKID